ncbi:MAG: response regulator [Acidobacteriia bacterium]|nr:response regulator [Terriglobia bacterium]
MTTISAPSGVERDGQASSKTVLVVEDGLVSKLVRTVLQRHGYAVTLAGAEDAAALLRSPDPAVSLLITNAPGDFEEFAERVPLLYLTSQPDPFLQAMFPVCRVVFKPFLPEDLVQAVETLLSAG